MNPRFSETEGCPKCGERSADVVWRAAEVWRSESSEAELLDERLFVTCRRCRYARARAPLDVKEG